jgi:hypothetical protein
MAEAQILQFSLLVLQNTFETDVDNSSSSVGYNSILGTMSNSVYLARLVKESVQKCSLSCVSAAFPPSRFSNKLDDKLAHKVALQTNVTLFCLVCQSEVFCKPNWFATNSLRQLCEQVCHQVCCKNVIVETHLYS